ncbi:hypothetical protein TGAMA5MH_02897 [Trichoderma gamsii]|uniref:N-acetyltransferase domain-containing protein n=1 Tax=Trichoderma gamsii TaxID=398673 RepID=A0A2K0TJJ3_9HYPO|nr:hypothetical protein TGAMA5MH_02897 [Trichoderma gamsii]
MPSSKYNNVELIPWDPDSDIHAQRLYEQRVACTWDQDLIDEWKVKVREGKKFFYWIKLSDDFAGKDELIAKHIAKYPTEKEAIVDTATTLAKSPRTPTLTTFMPIGHIALDLYPERNTQFSLPQSTVWIKSLYISRTMQSGGFGRSAMYQIEHLATCPPLNATTMALDTSTKEYQTTPQYLAYHSEMSGRKIEAKDFRSNEEWYVRQGYQAIARNERGYTWVDPKTGVEEVIPCVFLKKDIV